MIAPEKLKNNSKSGRLTSKDPNRDIKLGIWAYFLLIIFEGALRKWFLPGLATPLLIIRDPIALWVIMSAYTRGLLPSSPYMSIAVAIGAIGIFTSIIFGHGNLFVALYGARTLLIHFPLIFVIGKIFDREDVVKVGKVTLWMAIPMIVLVVLQFYSPQSAWVNLGVGGDESGAGFSGSLGFFRPPGTFSFTNGLTLFYSFVALYVLYFWLSSEKVNRFALLGATGALLISIPLSISRGLFFQVLVSVAFTVIAISRKPKYLGGMLQGAVGIIVVFLLFSKFEFVQTALGAFTARFEVANNTEGGVEGVLGDRYLGGMIRPLMESVNQSVFGYGLGMGTNVGSMLLSGKTTFLISEGEWGRIIGELGAVFGLVIIFTRISFAFKLAFTSYQWLAKGDILPWMLLSFGLMLQAQGGWAQPTSLGFCTLMGGLLLASFRHPAQKKDSVKKPISKVMQIRTNLTKA